MSHSPARTIASARCVLQVALLGSITPNLRAVTTVVIENDFTIYFYYDKEPREREIEIDLSEIVSTDVITGFIQATAEVVRIVLPEPKKIPDIENEIYVYFRYEEYLEDN